MYSFDIFFQKYKLCNYSATTLALIATDFTDFKLPKVVFFVNLAKRSHKHIENKNFVSNLAKRSHEHLKNK